MKPTLRYTLISIFTLLFVLTLVFLINRSCQPDKVYFTEKPEKRTIELKTMANGSIVPKNEIAIKSRISGILEKGYVTSGEYVKKGQLVASLQVIPNTINLNIAQLDLKKAKISYDNAKIELDRHKQQYDVGTISEMEYKKYVVQFELTQADYDSAKNNLSLIQSGFSSKFSQVSNRIYAPIAGTILDFPVKIGESIIESNTFNAGTTIAIIADMSQLIFDGYVVESEINKINTNMEVNVLIAAIENRKFTGVIDYISQRGVEIEGNIQFEIKAQLAIPDKEVTLRSGYSATAEIILDKAEDVITINERNLIIKENKMYVEIKKNGNEFALAEVKTGLSDGIFIEIKNGITLDDEIKVQQLYSGN